MRLRLAAAYRTNPKFRDYLKTVEARKEMIMACVKRNYTHGIKYTNAYNTGKRDSDWFRLDLILSWRKR